MLKNILISGILLVPSLFPADEIEEGRGYQASHISILSNNKIAFSFLVEMAIGLLSKSKVDISEVIAAAKDLLKDPNATRDQKLDLANALWKRLPKQHLSA